MPAYDLCGKVFFVTGGAEGIGRGLVEGALSKQGKVFLIDIQEEKAKATTEELGARFGTDNIAWAKCDVRDRSRFEECFEQAVATFGQVDVMVNNAGIVGETKPKDVVETNLLGTINGTEIASAHMRKDKGGKGGRVINVSSIAGIDTLCYVPVYGATKQAVRSYTQSLSMSPIIEAMGMEYGLLHPDGVVTSLYTKLKPGDVLYQDTMRNEYEGQQKHLAMDDLVVAFLELVSLEKMNGAMLLVTKEKRSYMVLESRDTGSTYPPPTQ